MRALEPADPRSAGRCRILARIGAGGMGMIYFGRSGSGRPVAVKVVHAEFARDPEYRERFRREVAVTRVVGGRYSPGVVDADPEAELPWLATEFLPSVSLREAVETLGRLPAEPVRPLAAGLVEALASVHDAGIVHLDVNPANILLTGEGPRLVDFGIAADLRAAPPGEPAGTRGFMSPEQASGGPVGPASDVFSLGATLAYACAEPDERLRAVIEGCSRPEPAERPGLAELAALLADGPPAAWPHAVHAAARAPGGRGGEPAGGPAAT
ncbi:serine/threonine-protein kinase, partial [Actinomadura sp. CNU-125]|uniref:serine/threonine-protein kinase n=1 Tax=Actinomadura sp. CNU-125 TaxID=1904961 RepID=UPI00130188A5